MKYKACIFDLDGTLVNTIADIADAVNKALAAMGYAPHPEDDYYEFVGNGWRLLSKQALPEDARDDAAVDALYRASLANYTASPVLYSKPYPGIPELLRALQERKKRLAVLTNKPDPLAHVIVKTLFPAVFEIIQGECPGLPRKPDPASTWDLLLKLDVSPRETVFVGDSEVDIKTAIASDCRGVGVSWGFRKTGILFEAGAQRVINAPEELLDILDKDKTS